MMTVSDCDGYMVVAAVATAQCRWWLPPTAARSAMIMLFGGSIVVVIEGTKLEIKEKTWEKEIKNKYTDRKICLYLHPDRLEKLPNCPHSPPPNKKNPIFNIQLFNPKFILFSHFPS